MGNNTGPMFVIGERKLIWKKTYRHVPETQLENPFFVQNIELAEFNRYTSDNLSGNSLSII